MFNVATCGATSGGGCKDGAGICAVNGNSSINYGAPNDALHLLDGVPTLVYDKGDPCPNDQGGFYRSLVQFECDSSATDGGKLLLSQITSCGAVFIWRTAAACTDSRDEKPECLVVDDKTGREYDLSVLSDPVNNWLVAAQEEGHSPQIFEINVCRAINDVGDACPGGELGVCQRTKDGKYSAGGVAYPQFDAELNEVYMIFENGDACGATKRQTRIDFKCNHDRGVGNPEFVREDSSCTYFFVWETTAACAVREADGCAVQDPLTNTVFNLTDLITPSGYSVTGSIKGETYDFTLAICEPLSTPCNGQADAGACQSKQGDKTMFDIGKAPNSPVFEDGVLQMQYNLGDVCEGEKDYHRRTILTFVCDDSGDDEEPKITFDGEDEGCVYRFTMRTRYACDYVHQTVDCHTAYEDADGTMVRKGGKKSSCPRTGPWHSTRLRVAWTSNSS